MNETLLFCATDAGGAKNIAPVANLAKLQKKEHRVIASGLSLAFFKQYNLAVELTEISNLEQAMEYLRLRRPTALVCGTTRYLSPERLLIAAARELKIKSIAILDEWFGYRARFNNHNNDLVYLPDIVCCQDRQAQEEAITEGLPADALCITGSPYLACLAQYNQSCLIKPYPEPVVMKGKTRPIITFLSETHAVDYGAKPGQRGLLGEFIGYSELSVRNDIFTALAKINKPCAVFEKLHPADNRKYTPLKHQIIDWNIIHQCELWPLLQHSDIIIGMRSAALLESVMLGKPGVSYQPNLNCRQKCTAVRLGLIEHKNNISQLQAWLKQRFSEGSWDLQQLPGQRFSFAREDSAENILRLTITEKCATNS